MCVFYLKDDNASNLCRQLLNRFDQQGCVLAETSIIDKMFFTQKYSRTDTPIDLSVASATIWQRWNQFRIISDFNMHFKVKNDYHFEINTASVHWFT